MVVPQVENSSILLEMIEMIYPICIHNVRFDYDKLLLTILGIKFKKTDYLF